MNKCRFFEPFDKDPEVCDKCGNLVHEHQTFSTHNEYREDLWKALLKHGSVHSYYGGTDTYTDLDVRVHLGLPIGPDQSETLARILADSWCAKIEIPETPCTINWGRTSDPQLGTIAEFTDTEADSAQIPAVVGYLTCTCGHLNFQEVSLAGKTMGQLMWLVTKEASNREG